MIDSATTPLLTTKLYMPASRESLVIRPRLHYKLSEYPNSRLMLVTAPAGSGKTTLVTSWLAKQEKAVAWLSLDKNDNDPHIFLSYVAAALHQIEAGACETIRPLLASDDPPAIAVLLTYFVNDLACLQKPVILVLDDYHTITSVKVDEVTEFLIENKPPNLQIIITSRTMPDFSVSRWRARNEIVEISAYDLRFNYDESWHFLHEGMQLEISDTEVAALQDRTEGWITGLQLAALGLRNRPLRGEFIHEMSGDDRLIGDYLVDEVIEQQPLAVRQFLVRSSILHRFSAPLCNALLEIDDAQELLNYLERSNIFLIALDNRRVWYRYHHLFGEMLRTRLDQKQPDLVPQLYQRAIQWHLENNLISEAIEYAIAAEDYELTAVLIEDNLEHFQAGGQTVRIIHWADVIPDEILRTHDMLWPQYILAMFYFADFDEALRVLRRLWHEAPIDEKKQRLVRALENPLLGAITLHTTLDAWRVRDLNEKALVDLPQSERIMRGIALGHYGSASLYLGDLPAATKYLDDAVHVLQRTNAWSVVAVFRNYAAELEAIKGNLHHAVAQYRQIQDFVYERGLQEGHNIANTFYGQAMLHYEWNQLDEAERLIRHGQRLADLGGALENMLHACRATIKLHFARGGFPDIQEKLGQIELIAADYQEPPLIVDRIGALRSVVALCEGKSVIAEQWADSFLLDHGRQISTLQQFEWLTVSRVKLEKGCAEECLQMLQDLQSLAQEQERRRDWIWITVLLARTWYQSGEENRGLAMMGEVLSTAHPEGYLRSFVDAGPVVQEILLKVLAGSGRSQLDEAAGVYVHAILDAFPDPKAEAQTESRLLTPREYEILQLLAEGLSYAQITDQLVITENTLKTHIKRIYSKLHVNNRMQAVLAAQDLGIL